MLIIGLMSGTSLDGVDASLVKFNSSTELTVLGSLFTPYTPELRHLIDTLTRSDELSGYTELDHQLASIYAQCCLALIERTKRTPSDITAIANHGQTIRHCPDANPPFSIQLGSAQQIANLTGITTIGQFRQADLAYGGQGAPLMPAFHQAVFSQGNTRYVLNIGGIANISIFSEDSNTVTGFDTGPGNTLMDQWIHRHQNLSYDKNGNWAKQGKSIRPLLSQLLNEPYFAQKAPKSTGPDYFNLSWLEKKIPDLSHYDPQDIQATLLELTAQSIAISIKQLKQDNQSNKLYLCGGGAHNSALIAALSKQLGNFSIELTDVLGVPADWVEAVGFAWLGYCCLNDITSNLPSVTGASKAVSLGEIFHPQK